MSKDWVKDIEKMHDKFGVWDAVETMSADTLRKYLQFRINFIQEECDELQEAFKTNNAEEIVDALIDICVVAIGTLDAFNVDAKSAWDEVHTANISKVVGVKESRPNPLGLPDLVKPEGWKAPSHIGNHGHLTEALEGR